MITEEIKQIELEPLATIKNVDIFDTEVMLNDKQLWTKRGYLPSLCVGEEAYSNEITSAFIKNNRRVLQVNQGFTEPPVYVANPEINVNKYPLAYLYWWDNVNENIIKDMRLLSNNSRFNEKQRDIIKQIVADIYTNNVNAYCDACDFMMYQALSNSSQGCKVGNSKNQKSWQYKPDIKTLPSQGYDGSSDPSIWLYSHIIQPALEEGLMINEIMLPMITANEFINSSYYSNKLNTLQYSSFEYTDAMGNVVDSGDCMEIKGLNLGNIRVVVNLNKYKDANGTLQNSFNDETLIAYNRDNEIGKIWYSRYSTINPFNNNYVSFYLDENAAKSVKEKILASECYYLTEIANQNFIRFNLI